MFKNVALEVFDAGFVPIPIRRNSKLPGVYWKKYVEGEVPSRKEVEFWFSNPSVGGVGVITGRKNSDNKALIMVEVESRANVDEMFSWAKENGYGDLLDKVSSGWVETTNSGGKHFYINVDCFDRQVPSNTVISVASVYDKEEYKAPPVFSETRGKGGLSIIAPSLPIDGGLGWSVVSGKFLRPADISYDEYEQVLEVFAHCGGKAKSVKPVDKSVFKPIVVNSDYKSVFSVFEEKVDWEDILVPLGWKLQSVSGVQRFWTRPGKDDGISATTGYKNSDKYLYVFSSSTEFDTEKPLSKAGVFCQSYFNNDFKRMYSWCAEHGYLNSEMNDFSNKKEEKVMQRSIDDTDQNYKINVSIRGNLVADPKVSKVANKNTGEVFDKAEFSVVYRYKGEKFYENCVTFNHNLCDKLASFNKGDFVDVQGIPKKYYKNNKFYFQLSVVNVNILKSKKDRELERINKQQKEVVEQNRQNVNKNFSASQPVIAKECFNNFSDNEMLLNPSVQFSHKDENLSI